MEDDVTAENTEAAVDALLALDPNCRHQVRSEEGGTLPADRNACFACGQLACGLLACLRLACGLLAACLPACSLLASDSLRASASLRDCG